MNPEAKREWIVELRSKRWRQISGNLCDDSDGRCIAGVLCEAYRKIHGGSFIIDEQLSDNNKRTTYRFVSPAGSESALLWAGLSEAKNLRYEGHMVDLVVLGDIGVPFETIATLIENQL